MGVATVLAKSINMVRGTRIIEPGMFSQGNQYPRDSLLCKCVVIC